MLYLALNLVGLYIGLMNYNTTPGQMILYGMGTNALVVASNGWKMPVYDPYIDVKSPVDKQFHIINPKLSNFPFLGDWLIVRLPIGNDLDMSPGDVLMVAGMVWILWSNVVK